MYSSFDPDAPAGLARTALAALLFAALMCWPLLISEQTFTFHDSEDYFATGDKIFDLLATMADNAIADTENTGAAGAIDPAEGRFMRSFGYATFASALAITGGALLLGLAQSWIAVFTALTLVPRSVIAPAGLLLALPMAATTLPWFSVFAMPDIFTAVVILFAAILWRRFDDLSGPHQGILVLLTALACLSHYGNPPLAFALFALVLAGRLLQRRLTLAVLIAAALPVLISPLANLTASSAVLDEPSTAPKRHMVLLARSIDDGPASWYLRDECAGPTDLVICAAFEGDVPDDITDFLWSDQGIPSLDTTQVAAIRKEEPRILLAAFLAYPVAQTQSLFGNAWKQFYSVGLAKIDATPGLRAPDSAPSDSLGARLVSFFDPIVDWTSLLGAIALVSIALLDRRRTAVILIVFAGLALNAGIFGGLSAPDDRYQARIVWILPFLALGYGTGWAGFGLTGLRRIGA